MKGAVLSLCRFFSSLSTAHVRGATPLFSSASHFSIEDEELSFFADCAELVAGVGLFFFFLAFFTSLVRRRS